jgi:hypothetical protein
VNHNAPSPREDITQGFAAFVLPDGDFVLGCLCVPGVDGAYQNPVPYQVGFIQEASSSSAPGEQAKGY